MDVQQYTRAALQTIDEEMTACRNSFDKCAHIMADSERVLEMAWGADDAEPNEALIAFKEVYLKFKTEFSEATEIFGRMQGAVEGAGTRAFDIDRKVAHGFYA
ncbi:hypothetical protein AB0M45_21575 [Nocardia sp. NPDC051787]|uniref:hypothetical protein n=1 Tax=Nocardia sp. NPDC051787 TaxID=3155415 RepID=UPI00342D8743